MTNHPLLIKKTSSGFTIVEMLVVITILGLLLSVFLSAFREARIASKYTVAEAEMEQIAKAMSVAEDFTDPIKDITGSNCSGCSCKETSDPPVYSLRDLPDSHPCVEDWRNALANIADKSVFLEDYESLVRDPWGAPYVLHENELERPEGDPKGPCTGDWLRTVGPDGILDNGPGADDCWFPLPYRTTRCKDEFRASGGSGCSGIQY